MARLCRTGCLCDGCQDKRTFRDPAYDLLPRTDISVKPSGYPDKWPWPLPPEPRYEILHWLADHTPPAAGYRTWALGQMRSRRVARIKWEDKVAADSEAWMIAVFRQKKLDAETAEADEKFKTDMSYLKYMNWWRGKLADIRAATVASLHNHE